MNRTQMTQILRMSADSKTNSPSINIKQFLSKENFHV